MGHEILKLQNDLIIKYKYKKLEKNLSKQVQRKYFESIPKELDYFGDSEYRLFSKEGILISNGYERIVIGDYGAFIEFNEEQVIKDNLKIKKGQEWRINNSEFSIKYKWFTVNDKSDIKIYYQIGLVPYADYKIGMFYVSPLEIKII